MRRRSSRNLSTSLAVNLDTCAGNLGVPTVGISSRTEGHIYLELLPYRRSRNCFSTHCIPCLCDTPPSALPSSFQHLKSSSLGQLQLQVLVMPDSTSHPHLRPKAFIFGPQDLSFDIESFNKLHRQLHDHQWALDALAGLPKLWDNFAASDVTAQQSNTGKLLENLNAWISSATVPEEAFPLPNVLLSPLVVIGQVIEYITFLMAAFPDLEDKDELSKSITEETETIGLCTGTLSAFAVACSYDLADIQHYGAVGVRLAMLVGAIVDAEEALSDPERKSLSLSVSWNSAEFSDSLAHVLDTFPDVCLDESHSHHSKTLIDVL